MSCIRPENIQLSSPYISTTRNHQESFDLSAEEPYFKILGPGAYSPCMQGMHCMPSHLTKKDDNDLSKYMSELTTKSN